MIPILALFFLILKTVGPTVTFSDSGDFIACIWNLGITHPNGYPLHTIGGFLFCKLLPVGNIGFKANILSCLFSVFAGYFLLKSILLLKKIKSIWCFFFPFILVFSSTIWKVSVICEIYSMYLFFCSLIVYWGIKYLKEKKQRFLCLIFLFWALGITSHTLAALWIIPIGFLLIKAKKNVLRVLPKAICFFLFGISIFFYIYIRSLHEPVIDWSGAKIPKEFIRHITSAIYKQEMFPLKEAVFNNLPLAAGFFFKQFFFLWLFLPLGIVFLRKQKHILLFLFLFLSNLIGLFIFKMIPGLFDHEAYFMPIYFVCCLFISLGILRFPRLLAFLISFCCAIFLFLYHLKECNFRNYFYAYDYARNVLFQIPPKSMLFNNVDYNVFPLWYAQFVEKRKEDLPVFTLLFLTRPWYIEKMLGLWKEVKKPSNLNAFWGDIFNELVMRNVKNYQIFYTFQKEKELKEIPYQGNLKKTGLLFKIPPADELKEYEFIFRGIFKKTTVVDVWAEEIFNVYSYYFAHLGQKNLESGYLEEAIKNSKLAIKLAPTNASYWACLGACYITKRDYKEAYKCFEKACEIEPENKIYNQTRQGLCAFLNPKDTSSMKN